jgi:hypothetical protein
MDGTLAAVVVAVSLVSMGVNDCPTGCLGRDATEPRFSLSTGASFFGDEVEGAEVYLRREFGVTYGPFQPAVGISVAAGGAAWIGAGVLYTIGGEDGGAYVQGALMPGLYARGAGPDLGGPVEFRSGVEIGYEARSGIRYGLSLDHRSNAGLYDDNPGFDTLQFRVSWVM